MDGARNDPLLSSNNGLWVPTSNSRKPFRESVGQRNHKQYGKASTSTASGDSKSTQMGFDSLLRGRLLG